MAHVIKYETRKIMHLSVTRSVGKGQHNAPDDVLLVQFFLNDFATGMGSSLVLGKPLTLDGVYGMHTDYLLMVYQAQVYPSGPVDETVTREVLPETGGAGTMQVMNDWYCSPRYYSRFPHTNVTTKEMLAALPPRLRTIFDTVETSVMIVYFSMGLAYP